MYGIKSNQGKNIRGMYFDIQAAEKIASNHSKNDTATWMVISGELILSEYINGIKQNKAMFKIRDSNGAGLIGEWNDVLIAESFALNYSNNHVGVWEVTKGGRTVSVFSNGNKHPKNLSPQEQEQELATAIHGKTCHWNHIDQCGWEYDSWDQPRKSDTKSNYLKKAQTILSTGVTFDQAMKVITNL